MSRPVLFAATRSYERAENMRAIYDAYDGDKKFLYLNCESAKLKIISGNHSVMVTDDFPSVVKSKCIMLWHAIQGGKYIGLDQPYPYYNKNACILMDYIVTSGTGAVSMFARCSGLPASKILPLGMPRTDQYIGKKKGAGRTILAEKRAYLYAPTFRLENETAFPNVDYDYIDAHLGDDELFAVKAHTRTGKLLNKTYRHIIEIPSSEPSAPYLFDCDVVITDYSSIIFDGYLLNKPAILFEKDYGYTITRGMYMEYPDEYSSRYCENEEDMIRLMKSAQELTKTEQKCIQRVANMCDGHACERLCRLIHEMAD